MRGEIIGVLDLAKIFGYTSDQGNFQSILVLDGEGVGLSVQVDMVTSVLSIPANKIDSKPKVVAPVESKYLLGVTEQNGSIIPIIALASVASITDIKALKNSISQISA